MSPIQVGFIGTANWGALAHLPYLLQSDKYSIVAIYNSSISSAKAAISAHSLPPSTKAYDSPADLANDPDVQLIVCCVRVDRHYGILKPVLEAGGKADIFCEWPLGKNFEETEELAALATAKGVKTIVGLQGRMSPFPRKVKQLLESGRLGKVLSTSVIMTAHNFGPKEPEYTESMYNPGIGVNMITVHFSHAFDVFTDTVGQPRSFTSIIENSRNVVKLINNEGKVAKTIPSKLHDQILLQGHLQSGAPFSFHFRGGPPIPGTPGVVWQIYGEKGQISLTTVSEVEGSSVIESSSVLHMDNSHFKVVLHDFETGEVQAIEAEKDKLSELSPLSRNVARLYEAFADGRTTEYADWEEALKRHRLVQGLYRREKEKSAEQPAEYLT